VCACVRACVHNSKTMKSSSRKLCKHSKGTPRKCVSENWVFGLIKTPTLKIINGLVNYSFIMRILGHLAVPRSRWGFHLPCFFGLLNNALTWNSCDDLLMITFFVFHFLHSYHQVPDHHTYESLINARICQRSWLYFISAHAITSRIS